MSEECNDEAFDITRLAREHAPAAMKELARLIHESGSDASRIAAIKEMLALACGKVERTANDEGPMVVRMVDDWARPIS
jgi:hypothetical protein